MLETTPAQSRDAEVTELVDLFGCSASLGSGEGPGIRSSFSLTARNQGSSGDALPSRIWASSGLAEGKGCPKLGAGYGGFAGCSDGSFVIDG